MRIVLIAVAGLLLAQHPIPRYEDFPVTEAYKGKNAPLALSGLDREFRTRLRSAATQKPNLEGHYILTAWGRGAECLMGAAIDANTGRVYWLPHTICCWPADVDGKFRPIAYRLNSRLIVFSGERDEKEGDLGRHYYEFRAGKFILIKSVLSKKK